MDSALPLSLREYVFAGGQLADSPLPVAPSPRGKSAKGQLFVLVDADPAVDLEAVEELRSRLAALYYRDPSGSLTSTLRRAIQQLNDEVFAANGTSVRSERLVATVACSVIRGDDLYLALVGEATAYVGRKPGFERVGRSDAPPGSRRPPLLGEVEELGIELFHRDAAALQSLVLASSDAVDFSDQRLDHALLADPENLAHLIRALAPRHAGPWPFRCLVASPERPSAVVAPPPTRSERPSRRGPRSDPAKSAEVNGTSAEPIPREAAQVPREATPIPRETAPKPREAAPIPREPAPFSPPRLPRTSGPRRPAPPSENGMGRYVDATRPPAPDLPDDDDEELAEEPSAALTALTSVGSALRRKIALPRRNITLPPGSRPVALRAIALLLLFAVGIVVARLAAQVVQNNTQYASALATISQAQQHEHDALAQSDPVARRQLLADADRLAAQAYGTRPSSPAVATATARIHQEYQAAAAAAVMPTPGRLIDLPTPGDRLVVNGDEIGVLDRANSIVYLYLVDADGTAAESGTSPILVRKGDHVGSITVGDLLQLTWMPTGPSLATPSWLVLDGGGFFIRYDPRRGLTLLTLPDGVAASDVTQLAGSNGNLFVLSALHQSLGWYAPQSTGYVGPATNSLATPSVDLSDVTSFTLDSQLFLLHASGQLQSFTNGVADQFGTLPPDIAPAHPAGLAATPDALFVGDPQRSRIIQLSRAGVYQRALAGPDPSVLAAMRDLGISPDGKSLDVLSGSAIYQFAIPAVQ